MTFAFSFDQQWLLKPNYSEGILLSVGIGWIDIRNRNSRPRGLWWDEQHSMLKSFGPGRYGTVFSRSTSKEQCRHWWELCAICLGVKMKLEAWGREKMLNAWLWCAIWIKLLKSCSSKYVCVSLYWSSRLYVVVWWWFWCMEVLEISKYFCLLCLLWFHYESWKVRWGYFALNKQQMKYAGWSNEPQIILLPKKVKTIFDYMSKQWLTCPWNNSMSLV